LDHIPDIVPWANALCERTGLVFKVIPMSVEGKLIMEEYHTNTVATRTKIRYFVPMFQTLWVTINQ